MSFTAGIKQGLGIHTQALVLRSERGNILASNIANAAVPGFKARDFSFESVLAKHTGHGALRVENDRHFATAADTGNTLEYRVPTMPSLDGNTVELSVEQVEFSENSLRYQTSLELLNRKISGLSRAIRGE